MQPQHTQIYVGPISAYSCTVQGNSPKSNLCETVNNVPRVSLEYAESLYLL